VVLFAPLISAAVIAAFTRRSPGLSAAISVTAVLLSLAASIGVFVTPADGSTYSLPWIAVGDFTIPIGFTIDALSKAMMLVVTVVGTLIHLYSLGYMKDDAGKARYFGSLSLFMFSMLGIVFANNFVMMFIFWELVGVSSFLLIGHWFQNNAPPAAA